MICDNRDGMRLIDAESQDWRNESRNMTKEWNSHEDLKREEEEEGSVVASA